MHRAHAGRERAVVHVRQLARLLARAVGRRQAAVAQHVREAEVAHHLVRAARSPHHHGHAVREDGADRDVEGVRDGNRRSVRRASRETHRNGVGACAQARFERQVQRRPRVAGKGVQLALGARPDASVGRIALLQDGGHVAQSLRRADERRHAERGVCLAALERAPPVGAHREGRAFERRDGDAADVSVERPVEAADAVAHDRAVLRVGDDWPGLREVALLLLAVKVPPDGAERVVLEAQPHGHAGLRREGGTRGAARHVAEARVEQGRPSLARLVEHHLQAHVAALRLVVDGHRVEDVHRPRAGGRRAVDVVRPRDERHHLGLERERLGQRDLREHHASGVLARHVLRDLRRRESVRAEDGARARPSAFRQALGEIPFKRAGHERDRGGEYGQLSFHGGKSISKIRRTRVRHGRMARTLAVFFQSHGKFVFGMHCGVGRAATDIYTFENLRSAGFRDCRRVVA